MKAHSLSQPVVCIYTERRPNHVLRGSASTVLMATGLVNGEGQILTPAELTPLTRSPKICHR